MINDMEFETPMMKQYADIKKQYPDCLLFFRLGDFYELFMEDAEIGSRVLDITLTSRSKGKDGKIPMCGVPYHAVDSYLARIVKAGYKAAICEQTSDPKPGKEIVERTVVRILTPGTITNENLLSRKANNYVLTFALYDKSTVLAYADISTGEFNVLFEESEKPQDNALTQIRKISPSEILLPGELYNNPSILNAIRSTDTANIYPLKFDYISELGAERDLLEFFKIRSLEIFGISKHESEVLKVAGNLLKYLEYTQKGNLLHIKKITNTSSTDFMRVDPESVRNLELFESNRAIGGDNKDKSFCKVIDKTSTAMGGRMLKRWLLYPLISKQKIEARQNSVYELIQNHKQREDLLIQLSKIMDIERLLSKLGTKTANARDLVALGISIEKSLEAINTLDQLKSLSKLNSTTLNKCKEVASSIKSMIKDEPPVSIREGEMIRDGVNKELDSIKRGISDSKEWIGSLEQKEKQSTGISSLKVGFNSVFGYYIEVSKANSKLVPGNYVRKQTLVNSERYITEELKQHEDKVLNAQEKINQLEFEIFNELISEIIIEADSIQILAFHIAEIDCLCGFSQLALEDNYIKPKIQPKEGYDINLIEARHPVVETVLATGEFTPNNTKLTSKSFFHLITGPNMAGKSTYIRQVALIQILAQMGSFVPAYLAEISIVDGIYTRIGAGDALAQGLSTFMVEMVETAKILNNATKYSLIILDEVGRGTSTIDGLSIAKAVVEYIYKNIGAKTLFATHFHELTNLEQRFKNLSNYHIGAVETDGQIKFLHKVEKGGTDRSYGVEVAKLAGIPEDVIKRAKELLEQSSSSQLKLDI